MIQVSKLIATGLAIGLIGAGVVLGVVFGAWMLGVTRNPVYKTQIYNLTKLVWASVVVFLGFIFKWYLLPLIFQFFSLDLSEPLSYLISGHVMILLQFGVRGIIESLISESSLDTLTINSSPDLPSETQTMKMDAEKPTGGSEDVDMTDAPVNGHISESEESLLLKEIEDLEKEIESLTPEREALNVKHAEEQDRDSDEQFETVARLEKMDSYLDGLRSRKEEIENRINKN